jgi:hypothetical protein
VLHYLLQNMGKLLEGQSTTLKVEVLCTLLCFDGRNNYRSDGSAKRHWASTLLKEVEASVDGGWARELCESGSAVSEGLAATEVVYVL